MEVRRGFEHTAPAIEARGTLAPAVEEFVRFCYHRRRVGWPELYDEMCAVAARGVFRGWGFAELADQGICFTLSDLPGLAAVAAEVSRDERERARRVRATAKGVAAEGPAESAPPLRDEVHDSLVRTVGLESAPTIAD